MNAYEEKQEARRARLLARAGKARSASEGADARARAIADNIPMGQPILVGHHSEKRARRDAQRIDNGFRKAHEQQQAAAELERRADSVGTAGISADDPEAIDKLREKLSELHARREVMKRVNNAFRKGAKGGDEKAGWLAVRSIIGEQPTIELIRLEGLHNAGIPHPAYQLTNLGNNIRRVEARIAELDREATRQVDSEERTPMLFDGGRVVERADINRVTIIFDVRPTPEACTTLKRYGWRWSPTERAWMRQLNESGRAAAIGVLRVLGMAQAPTSEPAAAGEAPP